jgi:hypothetical protein
MSTEPSREPARRDWDAMKRSTEPNGHVPVSDVVRDEAKREIRVLTYGIERFAAE